MNISEWYRRFGAGSVQWLEAALTWRARRKQRKLERRKGRVMEWAGAFVWAVCMVLLINQYFLQAYQIPSGSMIDTLQLQDRIFVNKLIYGPELLPSILKLPSPVKVERNDVMIFESPSYVGRGALFEIIQRVIYMVTLSLVDIDRDAAGAPRVHFLIKRAVGIGGDRLRQVEGNLFIRPRGVKDWIAEQEFQRISGYSYPVRRLVMEDDYELNTQLGQVLAFRDVGLPLDAAHQAIITQAGLLEWLDPLHVDQTRMELRYRLEPHKPRAAARWYRYQYGWYVPDNRIMPLGDNRDNSHDGRFFGAVNVRGVLGHAMIRYWPLARIGRIR